MGIYLTKPSTDINNEVGSGAGVEYSVGEMQGWRKNMEDAHITAPGLTVAENVPVSLFGVFDGHGGKEVAKFVKIKYPDLLLSLESFRKGDYEKALKESFHGIDNLLEDQQYDPLLKDLRALPNPSDGKAAYSKHNSKSSITEVTPEIRVPSPDDSDSTDDSRDDSDDASPNSPPATDTSPLSSDEAVRMIAELLKGARKYRNQSHSVRDESGAISPSGASISNTINNNSNDNNSSTNTGATMPSSFLDDEDDSEGTSAASLIKPFISVALGEKRAQSKESLLAASNDRSKDDLHLNKRTNRPTLTAEAKDESSSSSGLTRHPSKKEIDAEIVKEEGVTMLKSPKSPNPYSNLPKETPNDLQLGVVRSEEKKKAVDDEDEDDEEEPEEATSQKEVEELKEKDREEVEEVLVDIADDKSPIVPHHTMLQAKATAAAPAAAPAAAVREPASKMSKNGTLVCNLKDHRVLAGCTAIVALLVGKKLFVANAGDSRAVLMRNGVAIALSEDHKPTQGREFNRIKAAGGYVNIVGRVNGNLNLSRSLGDLKYKQLKHLPPEEQIITAEPDITVFDVQEDDEFFILACDGIWDCLTNQDACDLVKAGLQAGQTLEQITNEILQKCLADDPRHTQGIGGDNMTLLIVRFKN